MSRNTGCTVYIGNLDEKVSDRVLYDIMIQAGRVVDLHVPRDRETDKPKGYAFAEYETEEIADYAVKLFSGLVTLFNRTLKFAIANQTPNAANGPLASSTESFHDPMRLSTPGRFTTYPLNFPSVQFPIGLTEQHNGHGYHFNGIKNEGSRRVSGSRFDTSRSRR